MAAYSLVLLRDGLSWSPSEIEAEDNERIQGIVAVHGQLEMRNATSGV